MMRQLVIAAVVGWSVAAYAGEPQERPARLSEEQIRTGLHQVIDFKFSDRPLSEAFDRLRGETKLQILVNWKALEAEGVSRGDPVSLQVRRIHASTALDLLLQVAAPEGPRLGWEIDNGVVHVTTAADLSKNVMIRVYDIRDFLAGKGERDKKVRAVIKLLTDRIDPASWREHGGSVASLRELQGQLIITQTAANHRAIIDLLESVRPLFAADRGADAFPILTTPK